MIDLSKIEDANLREELRAQIKADKEATIQKRLSRVKTDEETAAKLEKLKTYEDREAEAQAAKEAQEAEQNADSYLEENKLTDLESFKELKAYDKFMALEDDKEKEKFIKELKEKKPNLFKVGNKNSILNLTGATVSTGKTVKQVKVY